MSHKEKLSLRVEELEKQNKELFLQYKRLEQQIEKIKSENLDRVKNDFWYKYRSEVHKMFGKIYDIISKYPIILWFMVASFIISTFITRYTSINKIPFMIIRFLSFSFGCFTYIFPLIFVFFQLKIYLQFKNPKNFILILNPTIKFLYKSITTFIIASSFSLTLYLFMRVYILYILGNKINDLPPELLKYSLDSIMQGQDLTIIVIVMVIGITLLTFKPYHILIKSYLQSLSPKWKYYKTTYAIPSMFISISISLISLYLLFSLYTEIPSFLKAIEEDLDKIDLLYSTKFVSDILASNYQRYLILGAFVSHSMGLLVSEYFVDKQYIEEHNIS